MIVKFHAREKVVAVVRLITCWGGSVTAKAQQCFQGNRKKSGNSSMPRHLRKIHVSVLSFAEKELPPEDVKKVMASFERVLMPSLEKISTASCGWSTRTKDSRAEFCHSNMELQTGKRLQPYYDRADRPKLMPGRRW